MIIQSDDLGGKCRQIRSHCVVDWRYESGWRRKKSKVEAIDKDFFKLGKRGERVCEGECVYVCECVCVWVCMCVSVYVCECVCVWVCMCVSEWASVCMCVWVSERVCERES